MGYELDLDDVAATHPKALAELATLRARVAELERDEVRLMRLAYPPFCDVYGGIDLHEEASINASAFGREEEPTPADYLAALRTAIDAAMEKVGDT